MVVGSLNREIIQQGSPAGKEAIGDVRLQFICRGNDQLAVFLGVNRELTAVVENDLGIRYRVIPAHDTGFVFRSVKDSIPCSFPLAPPCTGQLAEIKAETGEIAVNGLDSYNLLFRFVSRSGNVFRQEKTEQAEENCRNKQDGIFIRHQLFQGV